MDVSRVDPEEAVVDFQTLEDGDLSAEIDEAALADHGKEDKVLVSIRCVVIATLFPLRNNLNSGYTDRTPGPVVRLCFKAARGPPGVFPCVISG